MHVAGVTFDAVLDVGSPVRPANLIQWHLHAYFWSMLKGLARALQAGKTTGEHRSRHARPSTPPDAVWRIPVRDAEQRTDPADSGSRRQRYTALSRTRFAFVRPMSGILYEHTA